MFNDTWIDHYGFIPLTVDLYKHDLDDDPDYSPSLDIVLARSDGRFVGFSFCRLELSDPELGEVMVIGIRRGSRGLGLGRILLTHSVRTLAEHGAKRIVLAVDSENPTGAERLYESVGFKVTSMKRRYQIGQDDVVRLATLDAC
jgi:mycothiol synthase